MITHYRRILKDSEKRTEQSLGMQIREKGKFCGGIPDENGLIHGKYTIYRVTTAIGVYCNEESCFYQDVQVLRMILCGLSYIRGCQHEDGLFDYIDCNFASAPDTAFCVKRLLPAFHYLKEHRNTPEEAEIYERVEEIIRKGANGILKGGFHTPNHRWAIASNLMECGTLWNEEGMVEKAWEYLRETIDCNEDGEYTEKSAGNYNRINNDAMITLTDITGDSMYENCAVRNLKMMLTYMEPDGSIFTSNSTRQDNGKRIYPRDYYMEYLTLGVKNKIPEFLCMAGRIMELVEEKQMLAPDCLLQLMNRPELIAAEWDNTTLPEEYTKFYKDSGIVRAGRKGYSYTIMKGHSAFLTFKGKSLEVRMKVCGGFFRHRSFVPESLERRQENYCLEQRLEGSYYLPLEPEQGICGNWEESLERRKKIQGPKLNLSAEVKETDGGVEAVIRAKGVEGAPFRVEFEILGARWMWNESVILPVKQGESGILRDKSIYFSSQKETVEIGPGFGRHRYTEGRFGSEPHSQDAFTLFLTDYTEFEHRIRIRFCNKTVMEAGEQEDERN